MSGGVLFLKPAAEAAGVADTAAAARKQRAAQSLERALAFALQHGDALSRLRAHVALEAEPALKLVDALRPLRAADGGFAPFAAPSRGWVGRELRERELGGVFAGALEALTLYADARHDSAAEVEPTVRCLEALQRQDGSFAPAEACADDARAFATALAAGSLGRSRYSRPEALVAAGAWLAQRWSPELVEGGRFGELAACSLYYSTVPDEGSDEALQWCGRALEKGFRSHALEALRVVQVLLACQVGSLPGASFAPEELLERLLAEQAADGGFDALEPAGERARVGPTIDAMRGIIGLCASF